VELANPYTLRLWGRERDEVVGKPLLEALPELGNQPFANLLDRVYQTGEPYEGKETPARIDWDGDGTLTEVRLNFVYSPLRNIEGDIEGVLVIAFDVTDEVTARMRMSELRAEAEVANRAKDEFLAMLGHELRNPLAPILTALQLMRLRGGDELEKERLIIERQADQLVRLIDDLLDVSRITRGKVDLRRERVEMSEVVARAIETASPALEQREHHLAVNVPHGLVVEGDSARLTQVIANLLMNAAKYTEHGGRVSVAGAHEEHEIVIRVRDTGIGIAPDQLPKVFGMFTQERQSIERSSGGLGLGLAIVKSLVAMHGGSVGVESEGKGHGSEFTVRLPAAIERVDAADAAATTTAEGQTNGRRRILVVDDNIDAAESLAEFVEAIGHTPRVAHDGPAALRVAEEFDPEIALIDIGLPILDGHELARHMRERLDLRQVRLIAVTGYGQEADRERTRRAGFDAHLVKPVDLTQLRSLIESYVAEMP
jgi:PAS domain S-box-containing protein